MPTFKLTINLPTGFNQICFTRVINSIIATLPSEYPHLEDAFELHRLCVETDFALRKQFNSINKKGDKYENHED